MHYSQRSRIHTSSERRLSHVTTSKDLVDDEECNSNLTTSMGYNAEENSLNSRITKKDGASSSSSSYTIRKKELMAISDVAIPHLHSDAIGLGETRNPNKKIQSMGQNSKASLETCISISKKKSVDRDNRLFKSQDVCMPNWGVRSVAQKTVISHEVANKALLSDQYRGHRFPSDYVSQKFLRKGSSSKAPHVDDVSAPLYVEKKYKQNNKNPVYQSEKIEQNPHEKRLRFPKNHDITNVSKQIGQTSSSSSAGCVDQKGKKKIASNVHKARSLDQGQRNKDSNPVYSNRGGLSNFVCSSGSDVLPSVSSSTLNSIACASPSDVFVSTSSLTSGIGDHPFLRSSPKTSGHIAEGKISRSVYLGKEQAKSEILYDSEEQRTNSENGTSQGQNLSNSELEYSPMISVTPPLLQKKMRYNRTTTSFEQGNEIRVSASASPSVKNRTIPTENYRRGRGPRFLKNNDNGTYSNNAFLVPILPFGDELPANQLESRRNLYENPAGMSRQDSRIPNRRVPNSSGSSLSATREMRYIRSSFSGPPPTRPPPPLPLAPFETFSGSNSSVRMPISTLTSNSYFSHMMRLSSSQNHQITRHGTSDLETIAFRSSMSRGEVQSRLTAENLSEQILMLEATILLGGIGLYDNYRDMRIDIDNMSYEELLALEERIGNVNTGLSEESILKCMKKTYYILPDKNISALQDSEIKCSICQEEFVESSELGVLVCGHNHHMDCIKQWLLQKNECPICKATALK